jgi:methionyl-tRNA synthetase
MINNKFYVTTPIYYATAKPHLGSLYSTLLADIAAKWNKLKGKQVFFLTGTDEHGQKIALEAQKAGMQTKEFVDSFIPAYKRVWKQYHIDYNYFVRTTDKQHIAAVQQWLQDLIAKGQIYKDSYNGWYCIPDETFVTEKEISNDQQNPPCPSCGRPTVFVSEESYFFKLSAYQDKLLNYFRENPDFVIPKERLNEVIKFIESGLKDLSISRTTVKWGVPFPGDDKHVAYVWADALLNYVTAIGYGDKTRMQDFSLYWPADLQVMGKDILRFHAIYWPAFLMASGLPLPKHLLAHGWIKVNEQKMSKSLGNVVDPEPLAQTYGADAVRYYLASQIAITQDGEFSTQALERHINTDLVNDLGNLLNRTVTLAYKNDLYQVPKIQHFNDAAMQLHADALVMISEYEDYIEKYSFHLALARLWKFIGKVNAYFHAQEPWKLASTNKEAFAQVISATCHSLKIIGYLLWPVMPIKAQELLEHLSIAQILGSDKIEEIKTPWHYDFYLKKAAPLFQKIEIQPTAEPSAETKPEENKLTDISIDDFIKIELIVGTIVECEELPKSDKLLKLQVDFGSKGKRQILSGVKKFFAPSDLINKQAVFVFNLAPRKMMGLESHGMLLTAQDEQGNLKIVAPTSVVLNGTQLK